MRAEYVGSKPDWMGPGWLGGAAGGWDEYLCVAGGDDVLEDEDRIAQAQVVGWPPLAEDRERVYLCGWRGTLGVCQV